MSKKDFFEAVKLSTGIVPVDGFGDVEVHELTLLQRLELKDVTSEKQDIARAKVVVLGCDMFTDADIDKLCNMQSAVLISLFNKIMALSGLGDSEKKG